MIKREYREIWKCDGCGEVKVYETFCGYSMQHPFLDVLEGWTRLSAWSVGSWDPEFCLCPVCATVRGKVLRIQMPAGNVVEIVAAREQAVLLERQSQESDEEGD